MSECINCGNPAELFCDFNLGGHIGGYARIGNTADNTFYACIDAEKLPFTCDAPICEKCATNKGHWHISGKQSDSDSIDYCPFHKDANELRSTPISEDEADAKRRDIWAHYRRKQIAAVG